MKKLFTLVLPLLLLLGGCKDDEPKPAVQESPTVNVQLRFASTNANPSAMVMLAKQSAPSGNYLWVEPFGATSTKTQDLGTMNRREQLVLTLLIPTINKRADGTFTPGVGTSRADVIIDGQVKATLDLDAAAPAFDATGACRKTLAVEAN